MSAVAATTHSVVPAAAAAAAAGANLTVSEHMQLALLHLRVLAQRLMVRSAKQPTGYSAKVAIASLYVFVF